MRFEIEILPPLKTLFLQYQGSYENIRGIEKTWKQLIKYAYNNKLLIDDKSVSKINIKDISSETIAFGDSILPWMSFKDVTVSGK